MARRLGNSLRRGQKRPSAEMDYKLFHDPVLGVMSFHPLLVVVIDTHHVQRLRHIRQLGACSFVFPTACHTRFEHSLGTAYIAGKLFDSLQEKRIPTGVPDLQTWQKQKLCVQIAALCHDIGHGPFSHAWENFRQRLGDNWTHDKESVRLLDELLREKVSPTKTFNGRQLETVMDVFRHFHLTRDDVKLIKKMICGRNENNYLFQIVCNLTNNVDVDKWEYIARDGAMLNLPVSFDFTRLLNHCCVVQNEIGEEELCFQDTECSQLLEMFIARGRLHDAVYKNTKVKMIEEMLIDAFEAANERLRLTRTPIPQLTDHIFQKILYESRNQGREMQKARELLSRIESRHLYKCLAQETFPVGVPNLDVIKEHLRGIDGIQPFIDEIGLTTVSVDMTGSNSEKPLKNVKIYTRQREGRFRSQPFEWDDHQDSLRLPLESLKRRQILLFYKGLAEFPEDLLPLVVISLKDYVFEHTPH